jgi:hypothetical protein
MPNKYFLPDKLYLALPTSGILGYGESKDEKAITLIHKLLTDQENSQP